MAKKVVKKPVKSAAKKLVAKPPAAKTMAKPAAKKLVAKPQAAAKKGVRPIPEGYHTVTPYLIVRYGAQAIDFYKRALGAQELLRMPGPDGFSIGHAELKIGDCPIMMSEEHVEQGCRSPQTLGGSPISFYVYVENVDAAFQKAVAAGAEVRRPVTDMFYGDRVGCVADPFGYEWSLATHTKDLTPEQIQEGAQKFYAQMGKPPS